MNTEGEEGDAALLEAEAPVIAIEPQVEEPIEPAIEPEAKPAKKPPDPLISEITKLRARVRDEEAKTEQARKEAADARALADRLAKGDGTGEALKPPAPSPRTLDDAEIDRRADYKLFLREVADMRQIGETSFGKDEFNGVVQSLAAYGADNDEFIRQVMAVDRGNAHGLLKDIAEDPARAIGLVNMNPTQRMAELTRMSIATKTKTAEPKVDAKVTPRAISTAPKPAPAISSSTSATPDWRTDKASDEDFTKGFNEMLKNRHARR